MHEKSENLNLVFFPILKDAIPPYLGSHELRSFSCTCRFFSNSLKEARKEKPIWEIIPGYEHTLFFNRQTGEIYGVGKNEYNPQDVVSQTSANTSEKISYKAQIRPCNLFSGPHQSFILFENGKLHSVGKKRGLELDNLTPYFATSFREIQFQKNKKPVQVVVMPNENILYLTEDKKFCSFKNGELPFPKGKVPIQLVAGERHALILCEDMSLYGLGNNSHHQLGCTPQEELLELELIQLPKTVKIKKVLANGLFSLILTTDNLLYFSGCCWLGISARLTRENFMPLSLPQGIIIKYVYAGRQHIIIQSTENKLYGCGSNQFGQLGLGKNLSGCFDFQEIKLPTKSRIYYVATGYDFTFVICDNDKVYGFGNGFAQLGRNAKTHDYFLPKRIFLIDEIKTLTNTCEAETQLKF
jgi:alpha-tubulin suppressor-like RCC1 family protein